MKASGARGASLVVFACLAISCSQEQAPPEIEPTPASARTTQQEAKSTEKVLILASSVQDGQSSREAEAARTAGIAPDKVHVVTPQQWSAMLAPQFMEYRAIIIGDAACQTGTAAFAAAVANRKQWSAIIDGNVVLVGADPTSNQTQQLVENAVGFALKRTNITGTGLYVALGCAYKDAPAAGTHVELLDELGEFKVAGVGCAQSAHIFSTATQSGGGYFTEFLFDGLLPGAGGCAARAVFTEFPRNTFVEVAIARPTPQTGPLPGQKTYLENYSEEYVGSPYILLVGNTATSLGCGDDFAWEPETCDLGEQGNGRLPFPGQPPEETCSWSCQLNWCGDGTVNSDQGEECDEGINNGRTRDQEGNIGTCSAFCKIPNITAPNLPPEALCKNVTVVAEYTCGVAASIDDGSVDQEDGQPNCVQDPPGPFATGTTTQVTLLCTDSGGLTDSCTGTVKVTDQVLPTIALNPATTPAKECTAGATYADPGATADDICEGNLTDKIVKNSSVNMGSPGEYSVLYEVEDSAKNKVSATRPVTVQDTRKPTLELNGLANEGLECGTPFTDLGARASDQCAGNLTDKIVKSGSVDHMKPNPYPLRYNVKDPSGHAADEVSRVVLVTDTIDPVLTPRGSLNIQLECGDGTYVDEGADATDKCAGVLPVTHEGEADQGNPGTYHIRYRAQDPSGNEVVSEFTRTVTVSDTRAPTVMLNGPANLPLECGSAYMEQGATASDLCDGPLTPAQSGTVDPTKPGNYTRTYTATDAKGLSASVSRNIPVTDTLKPVVTPRGSLNIQLECGDGTYVDEGATANDTCDGVLATTSTPLPSQSQKGTTVITYSATDKSGNMGTSEASRTVTVRDTRPPTVTLNGQAALALECGSTYNEQGATAHDLCQGALPVTPSGTVDPTKSGNYTKTYTATDAEGLSASATRTVAVTDTLQPVVTPKGSLNIQLECGAGTYQDEGADALDKCDGPLPTTPSSLPDQKKPGTTVITYTAKDLAGNTGSSEASRTVTVSDTQPPTLTVAGNASQTIECKTPYTYPSATANDLCAGDLTDKIVRTGGVNTDAPGDYEVTYTVQDPGGRSAPPVVRDVKVQDTLAPSIDVTGPVEQDFECNATYVDPGATANDACAGNLTDKIVATQTPNQGHNTSFTITYKVEDPSGNEFTSPVVRKVNVKDNLPPTLVLNDPANVNMECGDTFTDPFAKANDACFGDITNRITWTGAVDNKKTGNYVLTYNVTDQAGNAAPSVQRTVAVNDTLAPTVTVVGDLNINLECGAGPYNDQGATASDRCDGPLTATPDRLPDPKATGTTTIKYTAKDAAGHVGTSEASRTVTVSDTQAPSLALKGPAILPLECATPYVEQGASANDLCAGNLDGIVEITGTVNHMKPDDYTLTYNVKDPGGRSAAAVNRKVEVRDTTKPSIAVLGPVNDTHACGTGPYVDPGATANDLCYGDLTAVIEKTQEGNPNAPGEFTITYKVKDPSNNEFVSPVVRNVKVNDTEPPTLELLGASPQWVECGDPYADPGAKANDACFGDLSTSIVMAGDVNIQLPGDYTRTYNVTDPAGRAAPQLTRPVKVEDNLAPSIDVLGPLSVEFQCGTGPYEDPGATASDKCDGNLNNKIVLTGVVNPNVAGQYTLSYSVTDRANHTTNAATGRTVTVKDDFAPTITLEGSANLGLECGTPFMDPGAKANDLCAGDLTAAIVKSGTVDHKKPNTYPLTYTVTDPSGHTATTGRTVTVSDTLAPTLALNGAATQTLECGSMYVDSGATATDACVGDLSAAITREGTVNPKVEGNYQVSYNVKDPTGHVAPPLSRTVTVDDTVAPTIVVTGPLNQTHQCGSTYTDPGATANDVCYGDQTSRIVATRQNGNPNQPGSFTIEYSVTDQGGNSATSAVKRTVTVQDTAAPVLELNGLASQVLECGTPYVDPGAKATDACFGDLTASIVPQGEVKHRIPGTYPLVYNVTDAAGNVAIPVSRSVTVQDTTKPTITVLGPLNHQYECRSPYVDPGATANDLCAGNLTSAIVATRTPNPNAPGNFTITYSVQDPSGNSITSPDVRTVTVNDTTPPSITLNGQPSQFMECRREPPYVDPGARATDVCMGGTIPYTSEGSVNVQKDGIYTLRYWAVDNAGNRSQTLTRTVEVNDSVGPAITLIGSNPMILECADQYMEPGATAEDVCSGPAQVTINDSEVDESKRGAYKVNYAATDASGNVFTTVRNVLVEDHTAPTLGLLGPSPQTLECGTPFVDPGAQAQDACFGDLTHLIARTGSVDHQSLGSYTLTYNVTDPAGQSAPLIIRTVNVVDLRPPSLTVLGPLSQHVQCGTPYVDLGVEATDACAGNVSDRVIVVGSVNTGAAGQYTLSYSVTDPSGNTTSAASFRTVTVSDDLAPTLTLLGSVNMGLECGTPFTEPGSTANDLCSGDLTAGIVKSGTVDHRVPNTYPLTYTVTDPAGHTATSNRTVTVSDTLAPTLALNGAASQALECGSFYVDPGATATDVCAGDLTAAVTRDGTVNPNVEGNYAITYRVQDPAGHVAPPVSRTVTVDDTLAPTIVVLGPLNQQYECGTGPYIDPGATANDVCYGDLTGSIVATRNGSPNQPGTRFTIEYSVMDPGGNSTTSTIKRTVSVTDNAAPTLALLGPTTQLLECGTPYVDPGAMANDACFGDLTASVQRDGTVNSGAVGTYPLIYNVADEAGNIAIPVIRSVTVQDTTAPAIAVLGPVHHQYECGTDYVDPGATAADMCAGDLTAAIVATRTPNPNAPGNFAITYSVQDPSGNSTTSPVTRSVTVNDTTPPVVVLNGPANQFLQCSRNPYMDPGARATDVCMGGTIPYSTTGSVNLQKDGIYTLQYWAVDDAGNRSQTLTRTVEVNDSVGPAITLNGSNPVILECALSQYVEPGATADDICSGPVEVTIDDSNVDESKTGAYRVRYAAKDISGNVSTTVRNVLVEDHTAPVLTVDTTPIRLECNLDTLQDPARSAVDACQGDVSHLIIREFANVNIGVEGDYFVRYLAQDGKGNSIRATVPIVVDDATGPALSLTGPENQVIECGSMINLKSGVSATDACYGNVSAANIFAQPMTLPPVPGTYPVTYTAEDPVGNMSQNSLTRNFTIVDTKAPVLCSMQPDDGDPTTPRPCLPIADQDIVYECTGHGNNQWQRPEVVAQDQCGGTLQIHPYNNGDDDKDGIPGCDCNYLPCGAEKDDPATACDEQDFGPGPSTENEGLYYVQYLAWDESYNIQGAILSVYVQDTIKPTITINPLDPLPNPDDPQDPQNFTAQTECYLPTDGPDADTEPDPDPVPFVDPGVTAQDTCYGDLNQEVFGYSDVNKQIPGTYQIEYVVRDGAYNWADPVTRTVAVNDTLAPAVTVKPTLPLFPANNEMRTIDLTECVVAIRDLCEGYMNINNRASIGLEPITCTGPNCDPGDYVVVTNSRFKLRVQAGNNYMVPFTVLDNAGNVSTSACTFSVPPAFAPPVSSPQSTVGSGTLAHR